MKAKVIAVTLCAVFLCMALCGCSLFTADTAELLNPPELSGDIYPIAEAIKKSAGSDYTLKYPSGGDYRSAVVQNDIDGDGLLEAFAFYSKTEKETVSMYIDMICQKNGVWESVSQQKITAAGVDCIDFCDLDGDGKPEILVGWEIYGASDKQLAVYSFADNTLTQRILQQYTRFVCCDLNEDGHNEIMIVKINQADALNSAALYALTENGVSELYSCILDTAASFAAEPVVSVLSSGKPAVYIDETKGVGSVTEVLFIEKNRLVNPLFNPETLETTATLRTASVNVQDFNGDGIIEIPVQESVPSISKTDKSEKLYLTNWCSFNGEALTVQATSITNTSDGYYYTLSPKWSKQIAVLRDTGNNLREIYRYNSETLTAGDLLLSLRAVKKSDWESGKFSGLGYREITSYGETVFICIITDAAANEGLTLKEVKLNFKVIE